MGGCHSDIAKEASNHIFLSNGSRLFYKSYGSVSDVGMRGFASDIIIAEEFGEMVGGIRERRNIIHSLIPCVFGKCGRFVVTTSEMSMKNILDEFGFSGVYGHFFCGTRTVLTEKTQA